MYVESIEIDVFIHTHGHIVDIYRYISNVTSE